MKEQPIMAFVLWAAIVVAVSSQTTTTRYDPPGVPHSGGATTTRHAGSGHGTGADGPGEPYEETTVTTTTNCGCDICWVETKTHNKASEVSWDIVNTVGGATVCTSPSFIDHSTILSSCCLSRSGSYTVTCRDSGGDGWSASGFMKIDGVALCSDGSAFSTKANEFPLPSPFTITAGSACYADLDCLRSSRRRRSNPNSWEMGDGEVEDCTVEVNPRSGPVSLREGYFQWGDVLTLNGVRYENSPPPEGIRPYGNFTYATTQAMYSDWTLCVPPLTGTRTGGGTSTAANTAVARDALNGLGKFFDFKWEWDQKTIARVACEASHGEGGCVIGQCGCFSYYYRVGAPSCSCSKAVGEGEWVFANSGGCTNVSSDYGGEGDSIVGAYGFARVRSHNDCTQTSWRLASRDYWTRTLNHHVVVDLRASEYTPPAAGWTNLVPTSNDVTYVANDGSSLGDGYGNGPAGPHFDLGQLHGARMNLKATMVECTFSAWIYITSNTLGTIINDRSYNTREFRISQVWNMYLQLYNNFPANDVWHHVVQVWQGPSGPNNYFKWTAYVNGEELPPGADTSSGADISLTQQSTRRLEFGGQESDSPGLPDALVSDIAVFDRVLTTFEVIELYASGRPSDTRTPLSIFNASWTVNSGNCKAAGPCAKTPLFPLAALANDNCTVTMNSPSRVNTAGFDSPDVVFNGKTYSGAAHVNGLTPTGPISFGFTETSYGWQICTGGPSLCGETCAANAGVTCKPGMQGCGPSLLEDSFDCSAHTSRPYADAATCDDRHWVSLDLGSVTEVSSATLSGGCRTAQHCGRGVAISTDGTTWTVVYAQAPGWSRAEGNSGITMTFGRQKTRYVRVASSRSKTTARAQFMRLTLASKCEDDTTWTDVKYGSGYFKCHHMSSRPLWCTLRTAYSVEAAKACPVSCGLCTEPFTKVTGTCHRDLMIDETTDSNYIETATACYIRCLSDSSCSHFEWDPAKTCRRFTLCLPQQGGGGGGLVTAQTYSMPNLAPISKAHDPVTNNFLWRGSFTARTTGSCQANPSSSWECKEAATRLGFSIGYDEDNVLDPAMEPVCYLKKDAYGYIFSWTTDHQPQGCETPDYTCICRESGEKAVALYNLTSVDPKSFIFSLEVTPNPTADTVNLCLMRDGKRCRGKMRTLQALGASSADVQAAASTATISSGLPLRLGPQVVHYAVDWDGDGDKDLLLGRLSGELVYLENINGAFDVSSAVGIARATSTKQCRQAWQSFSGDHLVDPFCGHWCCYTENIGDICYLEDNSGWANCQTDSAFGVSTGADQGLHPVPVDWDGDGDLDILAGTCIGKMKYFRNNGRGAVPPFTELTGSDNPFSDIPERVGGSECLYPDIADWDGDGDRDLILGRDSGTVEYYENELGTFILRTGDTNPLNHVHVEGRAVPSVADIDGDGDLDLVVGSQDGTLTYFNRAALGNLVSIGNLPYSVPSNLIPRLVDIDSDGLIDLLVADGESGQMRFFMSVTDNTLREQLTSFNPFTGLEIEIGAVPQAADWNNDGTFEFFVGGDSGSIIHFESSQDATLKTVSSSHVQDLTGKPKPVQQVVDWNGDGRADLIVGRADGEVLFHERLSDDSLAPGVALIPATGNSFVSPHAVDWDGDGDLDLIVGDSGPSPPRTLTLTGFPNADWNTVYTEKRELDMLIEGFPVYVSDANWVLAVCTADKRWFLFHNSSSTVWQDNRNGNCVGQMAYWGQGYYITDRSLVGSEGMWQIHGSQTGSGTTEVPGGVRTVPITSEGNSAKPHCDVCNRASGAECNTCDLSETMLSTCAKELCQAQGYDAGLPVDAESVPASACECQNTDNGATDLYGVGCANYLAEWCGRFDDALFTSTNLCCLCGGGFQTNATMINSFQIKAECFQINVFSVAPEATIASITPDLEPLGTIKYYERADNTSNTLTQKPPNAHQNPFGSITTSNRPYPFVVDWDKDGYKDLILGSASDEAVTLSSNGSADAPFCSLRFTACVWDHDTQTRCGNAFCRAAGYSWGEYSSHQAPEEVCNLASVSGTEGPPAPRVWHYDPVTNRMEQSVPQIKIALTVQCRAAGAIRFFKQTVGGNLQELTNAANPFDGIKKVNFVAASVVDWDGDSEWEVIIGDNSFSLQYFKTGSPCQSEQPCSGKGLCHPVLGTCGCIAGYKLHDCSSCDTFYYTERSSTASSSACLACPGVGSVGGVCETRGLCNDDKSARELSGGSNSTVNFYIGTGLCACSPYYSGDCTVGACPAGMEPVTGNLSTFECTPCEAGYFKDAAGNVACRPCAAGTYSPATGASVCTDCPAGRSQSRAGQDQCSQCLPGSASMIGSKTCTECPIGTHAKNEEMGACLPCPPGSWSDTAGARECTKCVPGEFSSGEMACQSCFQGSYSAAEGMANCTLCPAGTYSSAVGAASEDVCTACAEGKFSSMPGMEAEAACISCGSGPTAGATTMEGGATSRGQCIQPNSANFKCISGLTCSIYVTGNQLEAELHKATITDGSFYYPSAASPNGQNYTWVFPLSTGGGTFDLKWCAGVHTTCLQNNEFQFELGTLEVAGPKALPAAVVCVRGRPCEDNGPVEGVSLPSQSDLNMIQAQGTCGSGPKIAMHAYEAQPYAVVAGGNLTFGFGGPPVTVEPSTSYEVCWCAAVNGNDCKTTWDYRTKISALTVEGPRPGQEKQCYLGQDCDLQEIKGVNVKAGDRLMVLDRCGGEGRPVAGVPGDSIAEWESSTADGSTFKFLPLNNTGKKVLRSFPGIYRICFCRALDSSMKCEKPEDFQADVGLFTAKGPYSDHNIGCFLGSDCTLEKIRGVGMENGDTVLIQKNGCSSAKDEAVPAGLPSAKTAGTESGTTYKLGSLTTAKTGAYHICWRQSYGDTHGWSMGYLHVTCPAGTFRFRQGCEVCPLGHYCTGGTAFLLFLDDNKERCFDGGATTNSTGATRAEDCECAQGRYKGTTACQLCPAARYKDVIGNAAECPGVCPNGTTSRQGASSPDHCYSQVILGDQRLDEAEVFVLSGNITVSSTSCEQADRIRTERELRKSIANMLQVLEFQVELSSTPHSSCPTSGTPGQGGGASGQGGGPGARRMQSSSSTPSTVTFRIIRANKAEVERMKQSLDFKLIQDELPDGIVVTVGPDALAIAGEKLQCPENMAFELGARPTSTDSCLCSFGYYLDEVCQPCDTGYFKDSIGNQVCTQCARQRVGGKDITLGTLAKASTSTANCTCPEGYYSEGAGSPPTCLICPQGHYCEGGEHKAACPEGSVTLNAGKPSYDECVCAAGYKPITGERNATHRCEKCPNRVYKTSEGDQDCTQQCPPNSDSFPGATRKEDCFCQPNFYYAPWTGSCDQCPPEGVTCRGGFVNNTLNHTEPESKKGFYLTRYAAAEKCGIDNSDGTGSVCQAGATFNNNASACAGHQTGVLCGACKHMTVRDLGDKPCKPCDPNLGDWVYVGSLLMDMGTKAVFGIFLGKQQMTAVTKTKKMDAIILRILLQWITAVSVLQSFSLPDLQLYDWSKEEAAQEATAAQAVDVKEGKKEPSSLQNLASGLNIKFEFPPEFQPVWSFMVSVKGSIPSVQSPMESVECLVHRQFPTDDPTETPGWLQLMIPAIYWFCFPISVILVVYLLCLIFCKIIWPIAEWMARRAKDKLEKLLLTMGASKPTVKKAMKGLNQKKVFDMLEDPASLKTADGLNHFLGKDVMVEVAAAAVMKKAGPQISSTIQDLADGEDDLNSEKKEILGKVAASGVEGEHAFVTQLMYVMDPKDMGLALTDTKSMPPKIKAAIEKMETAQLKKAVREAEFEAKNSQTSGKEVSVVVSNPQEEKVKKKSFEEEHHIFGIFRGSSFRIVFIDAFPLFLITLYSIWDVTTRRMLGLIQMKRILIVTETIKGGFEVPRLSGRWLYDTRLSVLSGAHLGAGLVGVGGLCVWSIGFLVALFLKLKRNKHDLPEIHMLMNYGYFYNGLEPDTYWWDVGAKKFDILCLYFVTFTEMFPDPKAKLIMYLGFAGIFWALHNVYHPFDDRQNKLADRLEGHGLTVRFVTLFMLQCLLILSADKAVNVVCAVIILVINFSFVAIAIFALLIEIPASQPDGGDWESRATRKVHGKFEDGGMKQGKKAIAKTLGGNSGNPVQKFAAKAAGLILGWIIGPLFDATIKCAEILSAVRDNVGKEVPHIVFNGPGRHFAITTPRRAKRSCPRMVLASAFRTIYKLREEDQRSFLASTIGAFLDHLMTNAECNMLPSNILDIFFALPKCLSIERAEEGEGLQPIHIRTARRICDVVGRTPVRCALSEGDLKTMRNSTVSELEGQPTAEDLNGAMIWLQRLNERETWEFLQTCCESTEVGTTTSERPGHNAPLESRPLGDSPATHNAMTPPYHSSEQVTFGLTQSTKSHL